MKTIAIAFTLLAFAVLATDASGARNGKRQLWGSIAYSSTSGSFGYAVDRKTKRDAETEAYRQCGDCDVIKSFRDACGAIAQQPEKFVWRTGASREIAEQKALQRCGADCAIAVWACTTEM
ncbi:MAG TPA: DUF4189 domain-containing protein [Burkholderiales bacterium]